MTEENSPSHHSGFYSAMVALIIIVGIYLFLTNPKWWPMSFLEFRGYIGKVAGRLSNDDPDTSYEPGPADDCEPFSDRCLFYDFINKAPLEEWNSVSTIGGAIESQRERKRAQVTAAPQSQPVASPIPIQPIHQSFYAPGRTDEIGPGDANMKIQARLANATEADKKAIAAAPLTAFVGKTSFDSVGGVAFLKHPYVRWAVATHVTDREIAQRVLDSGATTSPIVNRDGVIRYYGCEAGNCSAHMWAILIKSDGSNATICYQNKDTGAPEWFPDPYTPEDDDCPIPQ